MTTVHKPFTNPPRVKRPIGVADLMAWAYGEVKIDVAMRRLSLSAAPMGYGSSSVWRLGMRVDGGPARFGLSLDDDAVRVHAAVSHLAVLDEDAAAVIVMHARAGTEPEWYGREAEALVPVRHGRRLSMELDDQRRAIACRVKPRVEPHVVDFSRRMWTAWRAGLDLLARDLKGALWAYDVQPMAGGYEPWARGFDGTACMPDEEAA